MHESAYTFPPLLTVTEAAELLRTTPRTLRRLIHAGVVPGVVRLNRQYRVPGAWIAELLTEPDDTTA